MEVENPLGLDKKTQEAVMNEIIKGDKIRAMQIVVNTSGKGLKVSKEYVDKLWEEVRS